VWHVCRIHAVLRMDESLSQMKNHADKMLR
jgi:hypothetical protein